MLTKFQYYRPQEGSLAGQPLLHQREREGLANEPTCTSAGPCGMQMASLNMTFITTKYAYSLCAQIMSCIQQD